MPQDYELKGLVYGKYGSQSALAERLGWKRQRVSRIILGQQMPDVEELNSLSEALDTPVDKLIPIFLRNKSPNRQLQKEKEESIL